MYPSTFVDTLISESGLIPAYILLDLWQMLATFLVSQTFIPTKDILHITLRVRDENAKADD